MSERHGRGIIGNLTFLLGGKTVAAILSLGYLLIVTRALGPRDYGILILVNAWTVTVGGIIAFSGWHGIVRYGAQALEAGDTPRFVRLARFMTLVELGCGLLAMAVSVAFAPMAAARLEWPPEVVPVAQLYALAIVANMLTTPVGILQLAGKFGRLGLHPGMSPSLRLLGTILVWLSGGGLVDYLLVWLAGAIAEGVFMWALAWPIYRDMRGREPLLGAVAGVPGENQGLVRFLTTANADLTLRDIAPKAVPLVVGWMLGPAAAGIYSLAQRAAVIIQQPAIQLAQASYPVIAKLLAAGERSAAEGLTWRTSGYALLAALPVVLLLGLFGRQILQLMGGQAFGAGAFLLVLLAVGRAALLGAVPLSSLLIAQGRTTASIVVNVAINLFSLPLLVALLAAFGLAGAGWYGMATGIATLIVLALVLKVGNPGDAPLDAGAEIDALIDEPAGLRHG